MLILSLALDNVKSFEKAQIDFTPGTNAIVGQNGAGKSTILEAIGFVLFDSMRYRQSDFVREGTTVATVTVTMISSFDERRYQVVRRCGSSGQYYVYDPDLEIRICTGKTDVQTFLKEHMKVDPSATLDTLFSDAVGVPQGTLTAAFLQTPAARKGIFDALLQVEEYKRAAEKLREAGSALSDEIQDANVQIAELSTRLERLPALEEAIVERAKVIDDLQVELRGIKSELQALQQEIEEFETVQQRHAALTQQQAQLRERLAGIQQQLITSQQAVEEAQKAHALVEANQTGFARYQEMDMRLTELRNKQQQRQALESRKGNIEIKLAKASTERDAVRKRLIQADEAKTLVDTLIDSVNKQSAFEKELATLQQQALLAANTMQLVKEQKTRLQMRSARYKELSEQLTQADELLAKRKERQQFLTEHRARLVEDQHWLAQCEAEANAIKEQSRLLQESETALCPVCEQPLSDRHRIDLLDRNESKLAQRRLQYVERREQSKQKSTGIEEIEQSISKLDHEIQRLPRTEEVESIADEIEQITQTLNESQEQLLNFEKIPLQIEQLNAELTRLDNPRQRQAIAKESAGQRVALEERYNDVNATLETEQRELLTITEQLEEFRHLDHDIVETTQFMRDFESAYQIVLANRQMAHMVQERQAALDKMHEEHENIVQQHQKVTEEFDRVAASFDQEQYQQVLTKDRNLREKQGRVETQLTLYQKEQTRDQASVVELKKFQSNLEQVNRQKAKNEREADALDHIRTVLRQSGPFITKALIQQISHGASQIFSDLMQDYSRRLSWTEDYGICVETDGRERQFSQLSGGEQMSAALSVRLALLREMSDIDIAFFDEPTMNLDTSRREQLARQISQVKGFQQVFVISHDDTFEQTTDHIIRVEKKNSASIIQELELT
ncbi:SMC family ATPase [Chloroflexi bacterium TSY]|nr:SMC family ATPase [Chloroflexi bacterium TSY]